MISKILHFIWFGDNRPELSPKWAELHPDFIIKYWDDENIKELHHHKLYKKLISSNNPVTKSDIARLIVLDNYGGFYVDVDISPERPLHDYLNWENLFIYENEFYRSMLIMNGFMGVDMNSSFIDDVIEELNSYPTELISKLTINNTWEVTGPTLITKVWLKTKNRSLYILPSWFCNIASADPDRVGKPGYLLSEKYNESYYGKTPSGNKIHFYIESTKFKKLDWDKFE